MFDGWCHGFSQRGEMVNAIRCVFNTEEHRGYTEAHRGGYLRAVFFSSPFRGKLGINSPPRRGGAKRRGGFRLHAHRFRLCHPVITLSFQFQREFLPAARQNFPICHHVDKIRNNIVEQPLIVCNHQHRVILIR